jgi:ribosome biogenesis protein SSF1/2
VAATEAEVDEVPKSMVLRRTQMEKEGKYFERELRELLYPFTSMQLKESIKLKLKDILEASKNFGVKNLVFLTGKNGNVYLKFMVTPHGPTLTFKTQSYVMSSDLQRLLPKNKSINPTTLGVPMVICKGFEEGVGGPEVGLMHSLFKNLFPGVLHHKNLTANSFKRCVFVYLNKEKGVVEVRNYYLKKAFTDVNKSIKKMLNSNAILNFGKVDDVGDLLIGNDANMSDSDVDHLPNSKVQLEDNVLGKRKKHHMNVRLYVG